LTILYLGLFAGSGICWLTRLTRTCVGLNYKFLTGRDGILLSDYNQIDVKRYN